MKPPPYTFLSASDTARLDAMNDEKAAEAEDRLAARNAAKDAARAEAESEAGDSEQRDQVDQRQSGGE